MVHTLWQTRCRLELRFKEHICYITSNNRQSAYAIHVLQSVHEYGLMETTMKALITFCTEKQKDEHLWKLLHSVLSSTHHDYSRTNPKRKETFVQINLWHTAA